MKLSERFSTPLMILILLTIVSLFYYFWHTRTVEKPITQTNLPDSFGNNIHVVQYDKTGQLSSILDAPSMVHFTDGHSVFTKPNITLYNQKQSPWIVTANIANATANFKTIVLQGDVHFFQKSSANNPQNLITTTTVTIQTDSQTAYSDQPVTYTQKNNDGSSLDLNAIGFSVNKKTGDIELLSNVRGVYVPVPTKTN